MPCDALLAAGRLIQGREGQHITFSSRPGGESRFKCWLKLEGRDRLTGRWQSWRTTKDGSGGYTETFTGTRVK